MLGVPSLYYFSTSTNWLWQFLIPTVSNAHFTHTHTHTQTRSVKMAGNKSGWSRNA